MRLYLEVKGGLGNQLFSWAAAQSLQTKFSLSDSDIVIDKRLFSRPNTRPYSLDFLDLPFFVLANRGAQRPWGCLPTYKNFDQRVAARVPLRSPTRTCSSAYSYGAIIDALTKERDTWARGYLQEPEYLLPLQEDLSAALLSKLAKSGRTQPVSTLNMRGEYAAAHVRRGDYLTSVKTTTALGFCDSHYYLTALAKLACDMPLVISTDDPMWVRKEIVPKLNRAVKISDFQDPLCDFLVLLLAKQLVISNSTFSWWAAFAGQAQRVVAPQPWFNEDAGGDRLRLSSWCTAPRNIGVMLQ